MGDYFAEQALTRLSGKKYAQSEASENISGASSAPREEVEDVEGKAKEAVSHRSHRTGVWAPHSLLTAHCRS
jgi:hypothetical protein